MDMLEVLLKPCPESLTVVRKTKLALRSGSPRKPKPKPKRADPPTQKRFACLQDSAAALLCRPELTATLAQAMARLPPAPLDEWFRCVGGPADEDTVKEGDLVVRKEHGVVEGTVARVVKGEGASLRLENKLDGSPFEGRSCRGNFDPSSVALPGGPLGFTLLHAAAALKCSAPVISALLEGQSAAATDALGRTPLAVAVEVAVEG